MRAIGIALGLLTFWIASAAAEVRASADPLLLVEQGAEYEYVVRKVELPVERYGRLALYDLDTLAMATGDGRPLVLDALPPAPAGWPAEGLSRVPSQSGSAPLASKPGKQSCNCKTVISDSEIERVAVLYASRSFTIPTGTRLEDYGLVQLRVAYRDGVRAYLNGQLIATRNLSAASAMEPAALRSRGPEWEHFVVPLVPDLLREGENQLSLEVRPYRNAQGARVDAELWLQSSHQVVRGPFLQRVGTTSAVVRFDTDIPSNAEVEYGKSASLGQKAMSASGALARHHEVKLSGLSEGQPVHYRLVVGGRALDTHLFHVPPSAQEPLRFAVYGDMRGGHRVHGQIVQALLDEAIDFVIVTGDLVLRGSDEADWQRFFEVAKPLLARLPYYPVVGNHDLGKSGDERRQLNEVFALWPGPKDRPSDASWYSFDLSNVHFVMLDSNRYRDEEQLSWLQEDLRQAEKRSRAIFAAVHAGPYSRGLHKGDSFAAEHYAPMLSKYGVTLLFSGHDHLYQRGQTRGLSYMVSGGGGAPLYAITCGTRGKARCKTNDGMQHVAREHHYIVVTVYPGYVSACPKRVDKTPLEACIRYDLLDSEAHRR